MYFLVDDLIGLAEERAALAVADDDIAHAEVGEHVGGNLAGVGAALFKVDVLRADGDAAVLERAHGGRKVDRGRAHDDVAPFGFGKDGLELFGKGLGLAGGLVHFPVACDDGFTVSAIHIGSFLLLLSKSKIYANI